MTGTSPLQRTVKFWRDLMLVSVGVCAALILVAAIVPGAITAGAAMIASVLALPAVIAVGCFGVPLSSHSRWVRGFFGVAGGLLTATLVLSVVFLIGFGLAFRG